MDSLSDLWIKGEMFADIAAKHNLSPKVAENLIREQLTEKIHRVAEMTDALIDDLKDHADTVRHVGGPATQR